MAQPKGKYLTMVVRCAWCKPPRELRRETVWVNDPNERDPMYSDGICPECAAAQFPVKPKGAR